MRLIKTSKIASALREVKPDQIAVAYVGKDWKTFVDPASLREIIVSPTLGSNPHAIKELADKHLGWENVHFLDKLHTKMYIGTQKAAIGSFNLSRNGISASGLEELGVVMDDISMIKQLRNEFKRLKTLAQKNYPKTESKTKQLKLLFKLRNRALSEGLINENDGVPQLEDYRPISKDDFLVVWYIKTDPDIDYAHMSVENQDINTEEKFNDVVKEYVTFLESDHVEENTWILLWEAESSNGLPTKTSKAWWLYVDRVICQIVKDEPYTKLVVQFKNNSAWTGLFDLNNDNVQSVLKKMLSSPKFHEFRRSEEGESWSCAPSKKRLIQFISEVKKLL